MEHLSEKKCIALMLDLLDGKNREKAEDHLKICNECEKQYYTLLPFIKPYVKDKVHLSGMLKKRILNSAIKLKDIRKESKFSNITRILCKGAGFYTSIAVSAIVLIIGGIVLFFQISSSNAYLQIADLYGTADIDAMPARLFDSVSSGNTISTDDNSTMMLRFLRNYKLILLGKSTLTIDKAKVKKNKNLEFKYSLNKGTLFYRNNRNTSVRYVFTTPHALIKSQDADLMLQASKKASNILLMKGKLVVQDKNSSNKIILESPGRYIITDNDGIKMTRAVDPTIHELQEINKALDANNDDETLALRDCFQTSDNITNNQEKFANDAANVLYEQASMHIDSDLE
jgi:hypothetical protein